MYSRKKTTTIARKLILLLCNSCVKWLDAWSSAFNIDFSVTVTQGVVTFFVLSLPR